MWLACSVLWLACVGQPASHRMHATVLLPFFGGQCLGEVVSRVLLGVFPPWKVAGHTGWGGAGL